MADKGTGIVFVVDPDQYAAGSYARREQVGGGTLPALLTGGSGGGAAPVPKRWNPGTETWDVIPGP